MILDIDYVQNRTFLEIVERCPTTKYQTFSEDAGYINEINDYPLSPIPPATIRQIKAQIEQGIKFHIPYYDLNIEFSPPKELIQNILSQSTVSERIRSYHSSYLAHYLMTWILYCKVEKKFENFKELIPIFYFNYSNDYAAIFLNTFFVYIKLLTELNIPAKEFDELYSIISDIFLEYSSLPGYALKLLPDILKASIGIVENEFPPEAIKFTTLITILLQKFSKDFDPSIISEIFETVYPYLSQLDFVVLSFFGDIVQYLDRKISLSFISSLALLFWARICDNDPYVSVPTKSEIKIPYETGEFSIPNKLDWDKPVFQFPSADKSRLSPPYISNYIPILEKITGSEQDYYTAVVGNLIALISKNTDNIRVWDLIFIFIRYLLIVYDHQEQFPDPLFFIFKSFVFSSDYNALDPKSGYENVSLCRTFLVRLLLNTDSSAFQTVLNSFLENIPILTELFERFILEIKQIRILMSKDKKLFLYFATISNTIFKLKSDLPKIAFLRFINELFKETLMIRFAFAYSEFSSFFVNLLNYKSTRENAFNIIKHYVSKQTSIEFITSLRTFFAKKCQEFPDTFSYSIVKDFIEFVIHDQAILKNLSAFVDVVLQYFILGLSKNEKMISIDDVNRYVVEISMVSEPSDELMLIYQHMLEKSTLDTVLFEKLQKLIFDQKDQEQNIVKYPLIFKMLVNIFYPLFTYDVLDYISSLLNYSDLNSVAAHRADINLYLTEKLLDERNGKKLDEKLVDKILSLLYKIGSVISSPIIVNKYISLFCAENGVLSKYYDKYLAVLSDFLKSNLEIPEEKLPLEPMFAIEFRTFGNFNPNDGFTFTTWIYLDIPSITRLFEILEEKNPLFAIILKQNTLVYDGNVILDNLPLKKWFFLALTYKQNQIEVFFDGNVEKVVDVTINFPSIKNFVLKIGGSQAKCGDIGTHGLFNSLSQSQIKSIYQLGPRNNYSPGISNIFYKNTTEILELCSQTTKTVSQLNFAETIIRICKLDVLLPLFAQLDIKDSNGFVSDRLPTVLNLVKSIITSNAEQEIAFHYNDGFQVISHLLLSSKYSGFNYETYSQFYNVFLELSYEELRIDILESILLNFELWMSGDPSHFLKITSHWKSTLFPIAGPTIIHFLSCSTLLNYMRIYCWYLPLETHQIRGDMERKSDRKIITSIRHNIMNIISENYMSSLTINDFKLLLSQCMSCIDPNQVYDLLLLLNKFATLSSTASEFFDTPASFCGLHSLLLSSDEFVSTATLDMIMQIHKNNLIKSCSLTEHLELIFHNLKKGYLTQGMLMKISIITQPSAPELFNLCCYIANRVGAEENMRMLLERLEPDPYFAIPKNWCVWAVVAAINTNEVLMKMIFEFLALCTPSQWLTIYTVIEHVCRAFQKQNEDIKAIFLEIILSLSLFGKAKLKQNDLEMLYMMVSTFLFFRDSQTHNPVLIELLKKEGIEVPKITEILPQMREVSTVSRWDYFTENDLWLYNKDIKKDDQEVDLEKTFYDTKVPSLQFSIGLRISIDCDWIDHSIASKLLRIQMQTKLMNYMDFCFLVCGFLMRTNHPQKEFVETFKDANSIYKDFAFGRLCCIEIKNSLFYHEVCDNTARLLDTLRLNSAESYKKGLELFKMKPQDLEDFSSNSLMETQESIKEDMENGAREWRIKWSHMTIENAPWDTKSKSNVVKHYKQSFILCTNNTQVVLKRNKHFDSHKIASELRDSGAVFENLPKQKPKVRILHPLDIVEYEKTEHKEKNNQCYVIFSTECELVTIKGDKTAHFELLEDVLRIRIENKSSILIKVSDIEKILLRRKIHRPTAIEIFTYNGQTFFVNFTNFTGLVILKELKRHYPSLSNKTQYTDNFMEFFKCFDFTDRWVNGEISNFEYLMQLNIYSGRSYNDSSQYPFLPWVIKDYLSEKIDISDPKYYRDLTKPIGAIGVERLNDLKSRVKDLLQFGITPFLYSSYYTSPLSLYLYLMRMEPFTTLHIEIQSGRFDNAARLFLSVSGAFKSVVTQMNDYRELIPEFYCMPEFLMNLDQFDLGKTDGQRVNDVILPPWSKNAMDFVYKMRKFLESDVVSSTLNDWIDLVWGYKQRGENAEKNDNIFKQEMYDTIWSKEQQQKSETMPMRINEIESMINLVGQIPPQLFNEPHLKRVTNKRNVSCLARFIQKNLVLYPASFSSIEETERGKISLEVLAANMITKVNILITDNSEPQFEFIPNSAKGFIPLDICEVVNLWGKLYCGIGNSNYDVIAFLISSGVCEIMPRPRQLVSSISASGGFLAIASEDARIHIYKRTNLKTEVASIPSYRSSIKSVCISTEFHTVICGTSDNALLFTSLATYETYRVVVIDISPRHIIVTSGWGFVVVYGDLINDGIRQHFIDVYNINGQQIRHFSVDFDVVCWSSFKSPKGFDFIVCGTSDGRVFIFEAYFGRIGFPVIDAGEEAICVQYLPLSNVVICVTRNKISIAPYIIEENKLD